MMIVIKKHLFCTSFAIFLLLCSNTLVKTTIAAKNSKKNKKSSNSSNSLSAKSLGVQTGQNCRLERERAFPSPSPLEWKYKLFLNKVSDTTVFSERPTRVAKVLSTQIFVDNFDKLFLTSVPNTAVTFASKDVDDENLTGPLIVLFKNPSTVDDGISYDLDQSFEQAKVLSLNSFFNEGSIEVDKTMTVFLGSCSLFIDGWWSSLATALEGSDSSD